MKIAMIIVRTLMGALFIFASVAYLFKLFPQPVLEGNMKMFMDGMLATGYMLTLVKVIELICGIAFISGRFVTLATVLIAPIIVNILCVHIFLDPKGLPTAIFVLLGELFLAYYYRENYKPLFTLK